MGTPKKVLLILRKHTFLKTGIPLSPFGAIIGKYRVQGWGKRYGIQVTPQLRLSESRGALTALGIRDMWEQRNL